MTIRTVGHGTLAQAEFLALLRDAGVTTVVDVRRYPGSRRHPQFARPAMEEWLPAGGVAYRWVEALGGRRQGAPSSPHIALRNEQFRAYADHMSSVEFLSAVQSLLRLAGERSVAVMCAESVWWRCHRRLIADHLVLVAAVPVEHLFHDGRLVAHEVTAGARVSDEGLVLYDGPERPTLFEPS